MKHKDRIVVSSLGIISALGRGREENLSKILNEEGGIGPISLSCAGERHFVAGEVRLSDDELKDLARIPRSEIHSRSALLAMAAMDEALKEARIDSGLLGGIPFVNGTTVGGMDLCERMIGGIMDGSLDASAGRMFDCGSCTGDIGHHFGGFAFESTVSTACSSALNAIIEAACMVASGEAETVIAGGCECLTRFHMNGFGSLMIMDEGACKPFDAGRSGLSLGEGAAYLTVETEEAALGRGVRPLALISGYGNRCDAHHQTASSPGGDGAAAAMREAIKMAGLEPSDISYVNAHGTGTENNDASELNAMKAVFGAKLPPYSSTKAFTGHATSAAGSIEAAICLMALQGDFVPASLGCTRPMDPLFPPAMHTLRNAGLSHVICNSFGFGGNDSCLLLSRYDD